MEKGEGIAQAAYEKLKDAYPEIKKSYRGRRTSRRRTYSLIDEEKLKYVSSVF